MSYRYYEHPKPREAKGGIRAQSRRGAFGSNWWAKRWTQTLEDFQLDNRLSRGRSYARKGQVTSVQIRPGTVTAKVQGSRKKPYDVSISVRTISPEDWKRLQEAMADQPIIAAALLSGQMPENIEETFSATGTSMFPEKGTDLRTNCSCPDSSNPCKHVAAVYLILAEEFDRDPFLIFQLRGMNREDLLGPELRNSAHTLQERALPPEPLTPDPEEFWHNPLPEMQEKDIAGPALPPKADASLPQQLGRFPLWQGTQDFIPAMQAIYRNASQRALKALTGAETDDEPPANGHRPTRNNATQPRRARGKTAD